MSQWYDDGRLTYPEAEELVARYISQMSGRRTHATTVDVLRWGNEENRHHNRSRVYDALMDVAEPSDDDWGQRTAFKLPTE